jgi:biotin carboxyl carrier protein
MARVEVRAQIAGIADRIMASAGEQVIEGQPILIIEAMKMEIPVEAPHAGCVAELHVRPGELVEEEQILVILEV